MDLTVTKDFLTKEVTGLTSLRDATKADLDLINSKIASHQATIDLINNQDAAKLSSDVSTEAGNV